MPKMTSERAFCAFMPTPGQRDRTRRQQQGSCAADQLASTRASVIAPLSTNRGVRPHGNPGRSRCQARFCGQSTPIRPATASRPQSGTAHFDSRADKQAVPASADKPFRYSACRSADVWRWQSSPLRSAQIYSVVMPVCVAMTSLEEARSSPPTAAVFKSPLSNEANGSCLPLGMLRRTALHAIERKYNWV